MRYTKFQAAHVNPAQTARHGQGIKIRQMLDVKITLAYPHSLRGEVVVG
jgi:hypothetical protein